MFHHSKMTGRLDEQHAGSYVTLAAHHSYGSVTEPIGPGHSYVTFTFDRARQSVKLTAKPAITADIDVLLKCSLMNNPTGERLTDSMIEDMKRRLEQLLTARAGETARMLQQAN